MRGACMYSIRRLSGHTLWTGPALRRGSNLSFTMRVGGDTAHGRVIDAVIEKGGRQITLTPKWYIDLARSGISVFTNGQGLPGQLRNVMGQIESFQLQPRLPGFFLAATLKDDPTGEGLAWEYVPTLDALQFDELFELEAPNFGRWPTRTFAEIYPVMTEVPA